jgi:hypothetical protein
MQYVACWHKTTILRCACIVITVCGPEGCDCRSDETCPTAGFQQPAPGNGAPAAAAGEAAGYRASSAAPAVRAAPFLPHRGAAAIYPLCAFKGPCICQVSRVATRECLHAILQTKLDSCNLQGKPAPNYNDSALHAAEKAVGSKRRRTFDTLIGGHSVDASCDPACAGSRRACTSFCDNCGPVPPTVSVMPIVPRQSGRGRMRSARGLCSGRCGGEVHAGARCHAGRLPAALVRWCDARHGNCCSQPEGLHTIGYGSALAWQGLLKSTTIDCHSPAGSCLWTATMRRATAYTTKLRGRRATSAARRRWASAPPAPSASRSRCAFDHPF